MRRFRGGGKHKDRKNKVEKKQVAILRWSESPQGLSKCWRDGENRRKRQTDETGEKGKEKGTEETGNMEAREVTNRARG